MRCRSHVFANFHNRTKTFLLWLFYSKLTEVKMWSKDNFCQPLTHLRFSHFCWIQSFIVRISSVILAQDPSISIDSYFICLSVYHMSFTYPLSINWIVWNKRSAFLKYPHFFRAAALYSWLEKCSYCRFFIYFLIYRWVYSNSKRLYLFDEYKYFFSFLAYCFLWRD